MNHSHGSKLPTRLSGARLLSMGLRLGFAALLFGAVQAAGASTPDTSAASVGENIRQINAETARGNRGPCPPYRFVSAPTDEGMTAERTNDGESRRRRCYMYVAADLADTAVVSLTRI